MKECIKCDNLKPLVEFQKRKSSKDGFRNECKLCLKHYRKNYNIKNKEKLNNNMKQYYKDNKERLKEYKKQYRKDNKDKIYKQKKIYAENNIEKIKSYMEKYHKEYASINKQKIKDYRKEYTLFNKEKISEQRKIYRKEHKEQIKEHYLKNLKRINEQKNIYAKQKRITDVVFRISCLVRSRINSFIKQNGYKKTSKTFKIIGCSPKDLRFHIEKQFTKGMRWDLRGKIHIDHIIPLASANTEEELYKLCHYTNLQPLWAEDNLKKGAKY